MTALTTNGSSWQPQEQGIKEICGLLEQQMSPAPNSDKTQIWQQLQHYSQFPDFNNYLTFILSHSEVFIVSLNLRIFLLIFWLLVVMSLLCCKIYIMFSWGLKIQISNGCHWFMMSIIWIVWLCCSIGEVGYFIFSVCVSQ